MSGENNPPRITTILPTYCRPERLKKAIQSVLNQTYAHFQLCIYDNASGDSTEEVVTELASNDPRIKYHCHASNIGAVENFQYGLDHVDTPFFSFLSDDDFLLPEFYETAMAGLEKYADAAFTAGAVIDIDDRARVVDIIMERWPDQEYFNAPAGLVEMIGKYSNWTGILFRKEFVERIGKLDSNLKAIDIDYLFRIASHFPFVISKKPCAVFVQHPSSYSGSNGFKLIYPGWPMMMEKLQRDVQVPLEMRQVISGKLKLDFQKLLFMNVLRSLEKKMFDEALLIESIYTLETGKKGRGLLLATSIKICKALPFLRQILILMLNTRRFWQRRHRTELLTRKYKKWIENLEQD